ncbi:MAG TPA: S8 family serine peptidase [Chitinophagaceae bacterium]|nr:S8 family serine peptidase [Chitinophagaceae bacterium]
MKKFLPFAILVLCAVNESSAQFTRYIVKLKNKGGSPYTFANPLAYLSQRSIDRRIKYGIAIDSTDLPVTPSYITQIRNVPNVTFLNVSRWLNAVTIQTSSSAAITTINNFSFVQSVSGIASRLPDNGRNTPDKFASENIITELPPSNQRPDGIEADYYNYGTSSYNEIHLHNAEFLHNIGLRGQGMQIAMLDNGFNNYLALKAFDSINAEGRVLGTWDFVAREANVANDGSHGMNCFSIIGANIPGQFIGKAPKASFWLYQTEDNASEYPIEEFNWSCGAERADSAGADVISTSLGYNTFDNASLNHTYLDMNGNTTIVANAADMAAKKGLLVFAANGNEGNGSWHFLISPADGDSVVAVGAVNSSGAVGSFSSYGPSSDGQIKPDLASVGVGTIIQNTNNTVGSGNGTSFACPNMAGMATCLWQGFPEYNNMKILKTMQQTGSRASNPDDRIGYGIPNMKQAFANLLVEYAVSTSTIDTCTAKINWTSKDIGAMKYEIERKLPGASSYTKIAELNPQAGVILTNHSYQFINTIINSAGGTVSYRIRQIIDTAAATFMAVYIDTTNMTIAASCFSNFLIGNATSGITLNGCNATVNWTSRDLGNMKYEIERKVPGELVFTKVGELPAQAGTVLVNHNYQFNNAILSSTGGIVSYRIRQIIDTATATFTAVYIDTVNVTIPGGCFATGTGNIDPNKESVTIQPNPVSGSVVDLIVETPYAVTSMNISVYDSKGRLMMQLNNSKGTGKKTITLNITVIAKGKYYIRVLNGQKSIGTAEMLKL